jgi:hypothetical protein
MLYQLRQQIRLRYHELPQRRAALGKALLVWLFSGSLGLALLVFIIFKAMGH